MKCRALIILVCCLCVFSVVVSASEISDTQRTEWLSMYDDVERIDIRAINPWFGNYHENYTYSTSARNEIAYILNYIDSFHLEDDGEEWYAYDATTYSVKICMIDGSVKKFTIKIERFYDASGKQYAMDYDEIDGFLEFINALKTKKIILDNDVTFEPSKWAEEDVKKAIDMELVPRVNQINYKGRVTRLEVCRLIDNLLDKKNITKPETADNPFSDTTDKSIINLYNHGIIHGKSENEFAPYDCVTREELSKILANTYYLMNPEAQSENCSHVYADQEEISSWALGYVGDLHCLNIMIGNPENEFNPRDNVTKEELLITLLRIYM